MNSKICVSSYKNIVCVRKSWLGYFNKIFDNVIPWILGMENCLFILLAWHGDLWWPGTGGSGWCVTDHPPETWSEAKIITNQCQFRPRVSHDNTRFPTTYHRVSSFKYLLHFISSNFGAVHFRPCLLHIDTRNPTIYPINYPVLLNSLVSQYHTSLQYLKSKSNNFVLAWCDVLHFITYSNLWHYSNHKSFDKIVLWALH